MTKTRLMQIARFIFVTTQISALIWVFTSYGIAIYSTVKLGQVYTMAELSEPQSTLSWGWGFLKVLENIFEHNDGAVYSEAVDPAEFDRVYMETDILIDDTEKEGEIK